MIRAIRRLRRPASATAVRACSSSAAAAEPYSVQQKKKGRFVSPHLTVHKTTWEIHALSSVTNRVTGVFATIGCYGIGIHALMGGDPSLAMSAIGSTFLLGPLAKFAVGSTCTYHYLGAVRHVFWERNPNALAKDTITTSAYVLYGSTAAIAAGLAMYTIPSKE